MNDDDPRDIHRADCAVWTSPDPDDTCTCPARERGET